MSLELYAGPGPVPLGVASASWGTLAGQLTEASVILAGAVTGMTASWRGPAADMALASFANFGVWMAETIEHAGRMSGTTGAGSAAYAASALVMPSPAEIAVTKAAMAATTVAAASTGAGLGAALAANEAAEREMDIRATIAMEGYESASTLLSLPVPFRPAPPIAIPELAQAGLAGDLVAGVAAQGPAALTEYAGPAGGQILANGVSATASIATHAAGLDPTVGAQSHSGGLAGKSVLPAATGSAGGGAMLGAPTTGPAAAGGGAARAGMPRLGAPMMGAVGAVGGSGAGGAGSGVGAERAASSSRMGPAPLRGGMAGGGAHAEDEHDSADYLRRFDRLEDGRTVVPAVIGAVAVSGGAASAADAE